MTLAHALAEDRAGHIERAADLYERVVRDTPDIDALINLAVLYWCSTDFGFWSGHQLPLEFVHRAADRFPQLLDAAAVAFPSRPEPTFWRRYTAWADRGEPLSAEDVRQLMRQHPGYVEPALFLVSISTGECVEEGHRLIHSRNVNPTCRNRYVASVIDSVLRTSKK